MTAAGHTVAMLAEAALAEHLSWQLVGRPDLPADGEFLTRVTSSTEQVVPGSLFVCVRGRRHDGHDLAATAVAHGASALVTERELPLRVPQIVVGESRRALGFLAAALANWPSRRLDVVGVTGTNGKTSTAHLLAHILTCAGRTTQVRGTLEGALTTPEAPELQQWLADRVAAGDRGAVLEVSSHALELERVTGVDFRLGVFTNLGHDHLDFHGTPERYFAAKAKLFQSERCAAGVVNRDDVHGRLLADVAEIPITTFGMEDISEVVVSRQHHAYDWRGHRVRVPFGGAFHVMNSLAALTAADVMGVDASVATAAVADAPPVRGRFEVIHIAGAPTVVVDFAHTPDALEQVLTTARALLEGGRLIVVFGCGGDRDAPKRPAMGAVAARLADVVVLTSDNPRSEDPQSIVDAIRSGVERLDTTRVVVEELDRGAAIATAVAMAEPNDVIVIAGKGHETTQTIGHRIVPFDDAAQARRALEVCS